eukprot:TRINITY_DN90837_c0_g1_i1.p1 TRINITY_DN90837_c0_g1~~TRINITY_DN90837_c0_g1_i1.p1  ORF type:complete len:351 (-),score=94.52 TRINITY_DN90837_c0_g1_i1:226-1278(-)
MGLLSGHVFASHIGHTGKTTITFQMSCYYAKRHPELKVLVMDLAEEGDSTKRFLGGVDAASQKVDELYGGVFNMLKAAETKGGLTGWLWSSSFDVMRHAVKVSDHNPAVPDNLYLISSGAWPRDEKPMEDATRKQVCQRILESLEKSTETWKLFCDTDGDRRPSPFTMLGYGLCPQAIVPLHLNKGDLDRTETMLSMMHELRGKGEIQTQVLFIVWNFVKALKDEPTTIDGSALPFTPTKVCADIMTACNKRLFILSQELPGLFVHGSESQMDFVQQSTIALKNLADNVLKPSEELGKPFVQMVDELNSSGKKSMKFKSGDVEYDAKAETINGTHDAMAALEAKFEAMVL